MSRLYGAVIDDVDTYEKWGLILLADLKIGAPSFEGKFIKIPGRNGMINASYGVSDGEPVYGNRDITFTLFTNKDETSFNEIVSELMNYCHGREKKLFLPNDIGHYYKGVFVVGDTEGYQEGTIPVSVNAEPYAYRKEITTVTGVISESGIKEVILSSEKITAIPTVTANNIITISLRGKSITLPAGVHTVSEFKLKAGDNILTVSGTPKTEYTISYQEARL